VNSQSGRKSEGRSIRRALSTFGPLVALALVVPIGHAAIGPLNDLLALGQAGGQTPDKAPVVQRKEPPFVATPRAHCLPGSRPEPGSSGAFRSAAQPDRSVLPDQIAGGRGGQVRDFVAGR